MAVNFKVSLKHPDEQFNSLMKRFKNKAYKVKTIKEVYDRRYFKKPSKIKRERATLVAFAKKINNFKILEK